MYRNRPANMAREKGLDAMYSAAPYFKNMMNIAHFECVACGHGCNADVNAALNILGLGTGAAGRGGGGVARPVKRQEIAKEAA